VCLPPFEGFGLVPLECLALGTVPMGFHGNGALDYLDAVTGAGMTRYPDLDGAAARIDALVADPVAAAEISAAGPALAARYRRELFDERWTDALARFLGEAPSTTTSRQRG
jgi:glycosyltransferase involved in cell wall biosynthesis